MATERQYIGYHLSLTRRDYERCIADGRRFFSFETGAPLENASDVKAALKADKYVVSRAALSRGEEVWSRA